MTIKVGFSLIELLVVIAIVGVLSAIGVPAYKAYTIKAQLASIVTPTVDALKPLLMQYYAKNGYFPANPAAIGITASGISVASPTTYNAKIQNIFIYQPGTNQCGGITIQILGSAVGGSFNDGAGGPNNIQVAYRFWQSGNDVVMSACGTYQNMPPDYGYIPANCAYGWAGPSGSFNSASGGVCYY